MPAAVSRSFSCLYADRESHANRFKTYTNVVAHVEKNRKFKTRLILNYKPNQYGQLQNDF